MPLVIRSVVFWRTWLLFVLALLPACLTPPALFDAGPVDLEGCLRRAPAGAEQVELASNGRLLRGVFVPAGADAPVVLHLLGSSQSVASRRCPTSELLERMRRLGFASLALDYGGVGVSEGERDVRQLREDALAMWDEAVRRADGDPARVLLRCTSIGGIAAAELLDAGARPGAVIWIAPVSPRSAVHQAVARSAGAVPATMVSWMFAPISRVEPIEALAVLGPAVLLVSSADDSFIDADYLDRLRDHARASGCTLVDEVGREHELLAVASLQPGVDEALWLLERQGAEVATPAPPTDPSARELWLADDELRQRHARLARLAPSLSSDELVAAARLESFELAAFLVWLRGARTSPRASFEELSRSYEALAEEKVELVSDLRVFSLFTSQSSVAQLEAAGRAIAKWDLASPLDTHWSRDGESFTCTLTEFAPSETASDPAPPLPERRALLLEFLARSAGLLVTRQSDADGTQRVCWLADDVGWTELDTAPLPFVGTFKFDNGRLVPVEPKLTSP